MSYCEPAQIYLAIAFALVILTIIANPVVHVGILSFHLLSISFCFIFLLGLCDIFPAIAWLFIISQIVAVVYVLMKSKKMDLVSFTEMPFDLKQFNQKPAVQVKEQAK